MRFFRSAGSALLAATVLLGACGGDGNDPTPFDPAGVASDLQQGAGLVDDVFGGDIGDNFFLVADALEGLGGAPTVRASAVTLQRSVTAQDVAAARDGLAQAVKSLVRTGPVTGSAVIIPSELLGTTFVWNEVDGQYVESARTDAPDNGVRFVLYTLDPATHEPAAGLTEIGYVDVLDLSTASADVARLIVVSDDVTYLDYRLTASGTASSASADVSGYLSDGEDRVNFDLQNDVTETETALGMSLDYELEFTNVGATLQYLLEIDQSATGMSLELDMSLRGRNGYVDMLIDQQSTEAGQTMTGVWEVNGDEFAVYQCGPDDETCEITNPDGEPLTEEETGALEMLYEIALFGLNISSALMAPIGGFFPLL